MPPVDVILATATRKSRPNHGRSHINRWPTQGGLICPKKTPHLLKLPIRGAQKSRAGVRPQGTHNHVKGPTAVCIPPQRRVKSGQRCPRNLTLAQRVRDLFSGYCNGSVCDFCGCIRRGLDRVRAYSRFGYWLVFGVDDVSRPRLAQPAGRVRCHGANEGATPLTRIVF